MKKLQKKQAGLRRRHARVRGKISGTPERPRLCITRSNSNLYAQVIDDVAGKTICAVSTLGPEFKATERRAAPSKAQLLLARSSARRHRKTVSPLSCSTVAVTCITVASRLSLTVPATQA